MKERLIVHYGLGKVRLSKVGFQLVSGGKRIIFCVVADVKSSRRHLCRRPSFLRLAREGRTYLSRSRAVW